MAYELPRSKPSFSARQLPTVLSAFRQIPPLWVGFFMEITLQGDSCSCSKLWSEHLFEQTLRKAIWKLRRQTEKFIWLQERSDLWISRWEPTIIFNYRSTFVKKDASVYLSSIGGEQALTPPKRRSLGRPLPYQLADTEQALHRAVNPLPCTNF